MQRRNEKKIQNQENGVRGFVDRNVSIRDGIIFGGLAGVAVGLMNSGKGIEYAFSSGGKEFAKCLALGTFNMSICRKLANSIENKAKAYALATIIPTIISIGGTYAIHAYIKGTPYPVRSTAPAAISAPFFLWYAAKQRKLYEKNKEAENESK